MPVAIKKYKFYIIKMEFYKFIIKLNYLLSLQKKRNLRSEKKN